MHTKVIVASKYGATKDIGEKIADVLQTNNIPVTIHDANKKVSLQECDAVILGSAIYAGKWLPSLEKIIKTQAELMIQKQVWFFSSGPTGEATVEDTIGKWKFPSYLSPYIHTIQPIEVKVFKGKMELSEMNFFERFIITKMKAPIGDYRDWKAIEEWGQSIANNLQ